MTQNTPKVALAAMVLSAGLPGTEYDLPIAKINDAVRHDQMQRAFRHVMKNEVSSAKLRWEAEKNADGMAKYNAGNLAVMVHDWRMEKIAALISGETSRQQGPKLTSDEKISREIARDAIVVDASVKKFALPKATDTETWNRAIDRWLAIPANAEAVRAEITRRRSVVAPDADMAGLFAAA